MKALLLPIFILQLSNLIAQPERWQQRIKYNIDATLDVVTNKINGTEVIRYTNNSPDTLWRVFFHAYWNAFQPGSNMDVRSRELGSILIGKDKDGKDVYDRYKQVYDRISKLTDTSIGYQKITSIKMEGRLQKVKDHETIMEIVLDKPILPKAIANFAVMFEAQVPLQTRRSGRDSKEGVRFSMSQWYPKMVEYDYQGWNANQYVAFEFYGVWGDYDVTLNLDKRYMVGATGTLQNPNETGFGYEQPGTRLSPPNGNNLTWHFVAQNVHDFVWAADPTYKKITRQIPNGPLIHIVHKAVDSVEEKWHKVADTVAMAYPHIAKLFGVYPYKNYSIIQGGDGGMEYPMATLIKNASASTAIHEWLHSWYQGMLGSNEGLYPWMDEGFTSYAESRILHIIRKQTGFAFAGDYNGYIKLAKSGWEEPMSTPADHFTTNYASAQAAYNKGGTFMAQLGYIVGDKVLDQILLDYYNTWRFKHPNPNDFIRIAEKRSNMELDWYKEYWVNTIKTIDYSIDSLWQEDGKTKIRIRRVGEIPMPVDVRITFKDSSREDHYVPLNLMFGEKPLEDLSVPRTVHGEWKWTHPTYIIETSRKIFDLQKVEIDPSLRLADIDRRNNSLTIKW